MLRKIFSISFLVVMIVFSSGCLALLAGGGTAFWQAGKVISEEAVSMSRAVKAVEASFKADKISVTDKVTKNKVVQLRGQDQTGKKVAVDVFDKGPKNVRLEVRYGLGEESPARNLLTEIKKRL
ncbi:MAG: DUF3568 domain-containing protein [Candidatus Omnitrophica bacterium]|nr:DUF3568 domain-containing protein [Candidatus Omnitrophota bacterium]MBU2251456.1 DUF3568 domain-containing protein [Candidatus Omnitrophota bacterium]MBU2473921.1 DUF3568 domain-containing protein [Candidatus Omnitrophota bacterium]